MNLEILISGLLALCNDEVEIITKGMVILGKIVVMSDKKSLSKIKESKWARIFGRLFGRQESIATLYAVVMMIPNVLLLYTERYPFSEAMVALLIPAAFYVLWAAMLRKPGLPMLISLPLMVLGAFQIVLLYLFGGSIIAVDMFTNLFTTNASEAGELLVNLWPAILFVCILYLPLLILAVRSLCMKEHLSGLFRRKSLRTGIVMFIAGMSFATYGWVKNPDFGFKYQVFPVNVCYNIKLTLDRWHQSERYHETSKDFTFQATKSQHAPEREIYVLVIGEASRAESWSLYGYNDRETTPRLEKREGVVPFYNVLTQSNATHKSVPVLLSPVSATNYDSIYNSKSLITAFKEAGFHTWYLSNQVPNRSLIDFFSEEADCRIDISPRDGELYTDNRPDGEMLPHVRQIINESDSDLLIVLHTYGSHYDYRKRYPQEFAKYQPDLISAINTSNRSIMVNAYDNSIYYTDYVLDQLIQLLRESNACTALLYCSDHGEDMMDDSRKRFLHASPTPTYYQLHVASFGWFSPRYRELYPEKYAAAVANEKAPATTAQVFHTLTDMASLQSPYVVPRYSLVNNAYNPGERYYLNDHNKASDYREAGLRRLDFEMLHKRGLDCDSAVQQALRDPKVR